MNNKKAIIITYIILFLIIVGLISYIIINKHLIDEKEKDPMTTIDNVSIDLNNLYQVGETLNKFDNAFNDNNSVFFGYIYKSNKLLVKDFDNSAALFAIINSDLRKNAPANINGTKIKNNFVKTYGKKLKYNPGNINAGDNYKIEYDSNKNIFTYTLPTIKDIYAPGYISKNIKTSLENDEIIVTRKVFYVEYETKDNGANISKASIYKNSSKQQLIGQLNIRNNELSEKEVLAKYSSKINTYKYIFKLNDDNEYNFSSIELIK